MRRMERKVVSPFAPNALVELLTAPAGHKYELLELVVYAGSGTGIAVAISITAGGTAVTGEYVTPVAAGTVCRIRWNALLLDEGDRADVILVKATGGNGTYHLTYMDVDFSG